MDSSNQFEVRKNGKGMICVTLLPAGEVPLSREEALNLAAWILAIVNPEDEEFVPLVAKIVTS